MLQGAQATHNMTPTNMAPTNMAPTAQDMAQTGGLYCTSKIKGYFVGINIWGAQQPDRAAGPPFHFIVVTPFTTSKRALYFSSIVLLRYCLIARIMWHQQSQTQSKPTPLFMTLLLFL